MTTQELAQKTLDRLRERGWTQGSGNNGEARCLVLTARDVVKDELTPDKARYAYLGFWYALRERLKMSPPQWNDAPGRTFEDVERLLTEMAS